MSRPWLGPYNGFSNFIWTMIKLSQNAYENGSLESILPGTICYWEFVEINIISILLGSVVPRKQIGIALTYLLLYRICKFFHNYSHKNFCTGHHTPCHTLNTVSKRYPHRGRLQYISYLKVTTNSLTTKQWFFQGSTGLLRIWRHEKKNDLGAIRIWPKITSYWAQNRISKRWIFLFANFCYIFSFWILKYFECKAYRG